MFWFMRRCERSPAFGIAYFARCRAQGTTTLYVTSQVLCEFFSVVTNPRRVSKPRTVADTIAAITDLLSFFTSCLFPPARLRMVTLFRSRPVTGGAVFDLQLVAAMLANGVQRIYSYNTSDFEGFKELAVVEP
jgi:predicted nucleic acid-binding protein